MRKLLFLSTMVLTAVICHAQTPAELVDTTIGTEFAGWASGYNVPGATRPFGMVQFTTPIAGKEVASRPHLRHCSAITCCRRTPFPTLVWEGASPAAVSAGSGVT